MIFRNSRALFSGSSRSSSGYKKGCFELSIRGDSTGRSLSYMCLQIFFFESRPLACFPRNKTKYFYSMCNNSCTITRVVSNKLYDLNPLRKIHPSWRAYVAICCNWYIIVGFLREWCSRAGGNWGTLWSLWGTSGKIRGITPPLKNPIMTSDLPRLDGRRPTKLDVPSALKFQMYLGAFFTSEKP